MISAGLLSLAVSFPETIRTNDFFSVESMSPWRAPRTSPRSRRFDEAMTPYLGDPFRGTRERRVLAPGETALDIELAAARAALEEAGKTAADVDLLLVASFIPDQIGVGNAVFLARELGITGAAWNLESACAGSVIAFETACALIKAGRYRNVLVVASCNYSRTIEPNDVLAWTAGDGAAAMLVGEVPEGEGILGASGMHIGATADIFGFDMRVGESGDLRIGMVASEDAGQVLRETSEDCVTTTCRAAARSAGIALEHVDFFVFNTPTAWFSTFAARALGVDPARTVSSYSIYANVGPVLAPANLHLAATHGLLHRGDVVLVYAIGSVSSTSAVVMRWGDVRVRAGITPVRDHASRRSVRARRLSGPRASG